MKKKEFIIVAVLLIISLGFYGFNYFKNLNATYAIVRDLNTGEVVDKINLNKDGHYTYAGMYGNFNLEVENNSIRAKDVECPNHSCEKMGTISKEYPGLGGIVCIPNGFEVFLDE